MSAVGPSQIDVVVFDLDGTLVDSDRALMAAFVACGVDEGEVTFGHVLADECARVGIELEDYLAAYDPTAVEPYAGVEQMLGALDRWAVCSNKHGDVGPLELAGLGWRPEVAMFADAFGGPKELGPVLAALEADAGSILFVGDTDHDQAAAAAVGCRFAWAGWNPRVASDVGSTIGGEVARVPTDVLAMVRGQAPSG